MSFWCLNFFIFIWLQWNFCNVLDILSWCQSNIPRCIKMDSNFGILSRISAYFPKSAQNPNISQSLIPPHHQNDKSLPKTWQKYKSKQVTYITQSISRTILITLCHWWRCQALRGTSTVIRCPRIVVKCNILWKRK